MIVKKLRLKKGWSQEQLSQFSGLSVRTIQRIERGQTPSLESLKSLAAVFQLTIEDLTMENEMNNSNTNSNNATNNIHFNHEEKKAMDYVDGIKHFYKHLMSYVFVMCILTAVNFFITPAYIWVIWPAMGWGIGIISHGIQTFELFKLFSPEWEKKQIEKRLGREL